MNIELLSQYLVAGITYGTIYAIVAIGFNIIYNATGIINFAQGEFVMLGGMIAVSLHAVMPLPAAILAAVLATMIIGALIEVIFIRWLDNPSVLRMIIITIGISIFIREAALHVWGEGVPRPPLFHRHSNHSAIDRRCAYLSAGTLGDRCLSHNCRSCSLSFSTIPC